jgi:hypothetical protein
VIFYSNFVWNLLFYSCLSTLNSRSFWVCHSLYFIDHRESWWKYWTIGWILSQCILFLPNSRQTKELGFLHLHFCYFLLATSVNTCSYLWDKDSNIQWHKKGQRIITNWLVTCPDPEGLVVHSFLLISRYSFTNDRLVR